MTHGSSWDMEIGRPSVEHVTLGLRSSCDMFNLGSSYFHVPLTTVRHLLNVSVNVEFKVTLHEQVRYRGSLTVLKVTLTVYHTARHYVEEYND